MLTIKAVFFSKQKELTFTDIFTFSRSSYFYTKFIHSELSQLEEQILLQS
jgi:hypothetical protein